MITRAKAPEPLIECRAANRTTTSFAVECEHSIEHDAQPETPTFHALLFTARRPLITSDPKKNNKQTGSRDELEKEEDDEPEVEDYEHILQNLTSKNSCRFFMNNLKPGSSYFVELWASNRRGNSLKTRLAVDTMRTHNTKLGEFLFLSIVLLSNLLFFIVSHSSSLQEIEVDPIYSAFFGAGIFGLVAIIVASFVSCRTRRSQRQRQAEEAEQIKQK